VCSTLATLLSFANPYFLYQIVNLIKNGSETKLIIEYLSAMLLASVLTSILLGQVYFSGRRVGLRARVALTNQIYRKALTRVAHGQKDENASTGKIVNLMSVDTERINLFFAYYNDLFIRMPISIFVAIGSLFLVIGWSAIVGVLLSAILGGISSYLGKWVTNLQADLLKSTDARVSVMNECLQGIRIVKYFAWEKFFTKKINAAREMELKNLVRLWIGRLLFATIGTGSGILIALGTFAVYTLVAGQTLDAATAFTAINLLRIVSQLLSNLPYHVMILFNAFVSADRIHTFLEEKNIEMYDASLENNHIVYDKHRLGFVDATFKYFGDVSETEHQFKLSNINIEFPEGGLTLICGPTGSGKSSLLLALLGELQCLNGTILRPPPYLKTRSSIAYCSQTAWLLNATIRDNILFGQPFEAGRYDQVIRSCSLISDFKNLEGGDLTEVGEKGINLSGGQKQRIALARACYSDASIVLLDDPLSAVDAPTAKHLVKKAILGQLANRTVILVSHAVSLVLPKSDLVILIKHGEVVAQGSPEKIMKTNDSFLQEVVLTNEEHDVEVPTIEDSTPVTSTMGTNLVTEEEKASGSVKVGLYWFYLVASGGLTLIFFYFLTYVLTTGAKISNDWWLKYWTDHGHADEISLGESSMRDHWIQKVSALATTDQSTAFYVSIYGLFGMGVILAENIQTIVFLVGSLWASRELHDSLLDRILGAPLRFFETTPIGRILNRFSRDVDTVDTAVMLALRRFIQRLIQILTILGLVSFAAPWFLAVTPFVSLMFIYVARQYLNASRELKRYESTTKSPIFAQFSETLTGVSTIRAYGTSNRFTANCNGKVDENNRPYFFVWAANRWLSIRTDIMSALVVFISGVALVLSRIDPGWIALTITYTLEFSDALLWTVRLHAELEMSMNSGNIKVMKLKELRNTY
jgi:ABC-type multidrug transport system fused ATPase/permease subunit